MSSITTMDHQLLDMLNKAIEDNLQNEQFGVPELAKSSGLSKSQLNRKLGSLTGQSASQFIREYRLKKAYELLQSNSKAPTEVAYMVGFSSASYFSTCFKEFYGYSPSEVKINRDVLGKKIGNYKWIKIFTLVVGTILIIAVAYFSFHLVTKDKSGSNITHPQVTIAILPFTFLGKEESNDYMADGVAEQIAIYLTKINRLKVTDKAFNSVDMTDNMEVHEIAAAIGIDYLISGSLIESGDSIRLIIKITDTKDASLHHIEPAVKHIDEVFQIPSDIALSIAKELGIEVSSGEETTIRKKPTTNLTAYGYYLRGQEYLSRKQSEENMRYASRLFEQAIGLDSNFVLAWLGRARAEKIIYTRYHDRSQGQLKKAEVYWNKVISLDTTLLEIKIAMTGELNNTEQIRVLKNLLTKHPENDTILGKIGFAFRRIGEPEQALLYIDRALEINPEDGGTWIAGAQAKIKLRRYNEGERYYLIGSNLLPFYPFQQIAEWIYLNQGDIQKAREYSYSQHKIHGGMFRIRSRIERYDRNFDKAISIIDSAEDITQDYHSMFRTKSLELGLTYFSMSEMKLAKEQFQISREVLEKKLSEDPEDSRVLSSLGISYAGCGMSKEGIKAGEEALSIMNYSVNAIKGPFRALDMAIIYLLVGEHEKSIRQLDSMIQHDGFLSVEKLKLDPLWDPLREYEAFNMLINNPEYQPVL